MSVAGRNTTSFAGNAKGAASRASVPPLSNARTIYRKGEQDFIKELFSIKEAQERKAYAGGACNMPVGTFYDKARKFENIT